MKRALFQVTLALIAIVATLAVLEGLLRLAGFSATPVQIQAGRQSDQRILHVFEDQNFEMETVELPSEDVFLAYTDGLTEARRGDELYGIDRVIDSLKRNAPDRSAKDLARAVYQDAREFGRVTDDTVVFTFGCDAP
jgi:hypothetical protein